MCFRYSEVAAVDVPYQVEGKYLRNRTQLNELDREAFLEVFSDVVDGSPNTTPVFDLLQNLFPKVCPMGLVFDAADAARVVGWESMCEKYHIPPVAGPLEDWPNKLVQMFEAVAEAKNDFEIQRIEDMK